MRLAGSRLFWESPRRRWSTSLRSGWAGSFAIPPGPVVNVWSTFIVSEKGEQHIYSVGGVMLMGVGFVGEDESLLEYVTPGRWLGPVIVERLG